MGAGKFRLNLFRSRLDPDLGLSTALDPSHHLLELPKGREVMDSLAVKIKEMLSQA